MEGQEKSQTALFFCRERSVARHYLVGVAWIVYKLGDIRQVVAITMKVQVVNSDSNICIFNTSYLKAPLIPRPVLVPSKLFCRLS